MNTKDLYIAVIFLLLFSLGCTKEEGMQMTAIDISFSPAIISNTRSLQGVYPSDASFHVWAYYLPKGKRWNDDSQDAQMLTDKHRVAYNGNEWLPIPALKWPGNGDVTFIASSPQSLDAEFSKEKGVIIRNFNASNGVFPLFTEPVVDCNVYNTHGCIALPFIHALSKVEFEVRSVVTTDSVIKLKRLYMDDIMYKGDFKSLPYPCWKPDGQTMCVEFCKGDMIVGRMPAQVGSQMLMGQDVNNKAMLVVDILDKEGNIVVKDRRIESSLVSNSWCPGKYYIYTLNLTTSSARFEVDVLDRFEI